MAQKSPQFYEIHMRNNNAIIHDIKNALCSIAGQLVYLHNKIEGCQKAEKNFSKIFQEIHRLEKSIDYFIERDKIKSEK